jgi:hypothetical protein
VKTAETGEFPGHRITGPSFGNARKLAGLRCGPVMRWPPMLVWPLVGQTNSSLLPSLLRLPVQKPEQRDPALQDTMAFPRLRESGQLLLRLRCSFLRVCASAELPALTPPPMSVSPLAVRVPRPGLALTPTPLFTSRPDAPHSRPDVRAAKPRPWIAQHCPTKTAEVGQSRAAR